MIREFWGSWDSLLVATTSTGTSPFCSELFVKWPWSKEQYDFTQYHPISNIHICAYCLKTVSNMIQLIQTFSLDLAKNANKLLSDCCFDVAEGEPFEISDMVPSVPDVLPELLFSWSVDCKREGQDTPNLNSQRLTSGNGNHISALSMTDKKSNH